MTRLSIPLALLLVSCHDGSRMVPPSDHQIVEIATSTLTLQRTGPWAERGRATRQSVLDLAILEKGPTNDLFGYYPVWVQATVAETRIERSWIFFKKTETDTSTRSFVLYFTKDASGTWTVNEDKVLSLIQGIAN